MPTADQKNIDRVAFFAPGGELFVASPTTGTTGGSHDGKAAILVLADDNRDGFGDPPRTFLDNLPSTQGLLFTTGFFYYQDGTKDCSKVATEEAAFLIGDTPFSFDFEPGEWPAPYTGSAFVPLHGTAGAWTGARLVAIAMDPETGMPVPSDDLDAGQATGGLADFASGYDDRLLAHGRPAAVTFAPDGRLFLGNDNNGDILWIAPLDLAIPH